MTAVTLPPGPSAPRFLPGACALAAPFRGVRRMRDLYGGAFTVNVPGFGHAVVISGATEIRQLFMTHTDFAGIPPGSRSIRRVLSQMHPPMFTQPSGGVSCVRSVSFAGECGRVATGVFAG